MGITIFFILISIVVAISTAIYVKKNNAFYNFKPKEKSSVKLVRKLKKS